MFVLLRGALLMFVLFGVANAASSQCTKSEIKKNKQHCQEILYDVRKTLLYSNKVSQKAHNKLKESEEHTFACIKGGVETLISAATDCNPYSPKVNPASCIVTMLELPGVYDSCKKAYVLITDAIALFEQAKAIAGMADVAFSDQGGDEIMTYLESCNEHTCKQQKGVSDQYVQSASEAYTNIINEAKQLSDQVKTMQDSLKACEADKTNCTKPNSIDIDIDMPDAANKPVPALKLQ